ncbi:unnamed protein product [Ectocarpus fasciculatus]
MSIRRGQIFLEETMPRNIATSMKDAKFVNFMHRTLRPNETGIHTESHPFVSYCGKEINYVSPLDRYSPFCFKDLLVDVGGSLSPVVNLSESRASSGSSELHLLFGADMAHPFGVRDLYYHPTSGRVYHKIFKHRHLKGELGLLHPFLAQKLAMYIHWNANNDNYVIEWAGEEHTLLNPEDAVHAPI